MPFKKESGEQPRRPAAQSTPEGVDGEHGPLPPQLRHPYGSERLRLQQPVAAGDRTRLPPQPRGRVAT